MADPDELLDQIRCAADHGPFLAAIEAFRALDEHMKAGGKPPADWKKKPMSRSEAGARGAQARLLTADPAEMTRAARESTNSVISLDRWIRVAHETYPGLTDEQAAQEGELLRRLHYVRMGRLSVQARKLARKAAAEGTTETKETTLS
jgi:hypothetical protein